MLARVVECGTSLFRLLGVACSFGRAGLLDPLCGLGGCERAQQGGFLPRLLRGLRCSCGLLRGVGGEVRLLVADHCFRAERSRVCRESCRVCLLWPVQQRLACRLVFLLGVDHARVVAGVFLAGERVRLAADPVEGLRDVEGTAARRALEENV